MTITRTFTTKFIPSYVAGTIVEIIHFRDMTFASDEMVAIYLDTANASMDLGSFNMAQFPEFEGDESDTEKVLLLNKSESNSNKIGLKILKRKDNIGNWNECAEIILVNRGRKDYLDLRSYTGYPTRIMEKNDAIALQLVDYGDGLLWDTDFISIDFGCTVEIKKKDDLIELTNRLAALESLLGLFGAATASVAGTNGLVKGAAIGEQAHLLRGDRTWQNPNYFLNKSEGDAKYLPLITQVAKLEVAPPAIISVSANTWIDLSAINCGNILSVENSLFAVRILIVKQYNPGTTYPWWFHSGAAIIAPITYKGAGTSQELNIPIEAHYENDYNLKIRVAFGQNTRMISLNFPISFSAYKIQATFVKLN